MEEREIAEGKKGRRRKEAKKLGIEPGKFVKDIVPCFITLYVCTDHQ